MIGIRKLGRLGMRTLIAAFVVATISCGGPGSAGVPNQDFDTADEFFAGQFSGRTRVNAFQVATFTFTGTNTDLMDFTEGNKPKVTIKTDEDVPDDVQVQFDETDNFMDSGSFDSSNARFAFQGGVALAPIGDATTSPGDVPISVTGQAGGPFANDPGGTWTMNLDGQIFTGTLIRGLFDD